MNLLEATFSDTDKRIAFLVLCIINFAFIYISQEMLVSEELFYNSFGEQLAIERIEKLWEESKRFNWLSYVFIPFIYLIKFVLTSMALAVGLLIIEVKFKFKKVFQTVLIAEFIFIIPALIRLFWFIFIQTDYRLQDISAFNFLSLAGIFETDTLPVWLLYPFQLLNIFEVIYWLLLTYGVHLHIKRDYQDSLKLVLVSYGSGLVLWVVFLTFIQVSLSA
jgi:hypothetical protein